MIAMKTNNFYRSMKSALHTFLILSLFPFAFTACNGTEDLGDPYFTIEGDPTGLSVDMNETTASFIVRSNRPWKVVAQGEDSWTRAFPDEGVDDGIFQLIVEENSGFTDRTMNFAFIVDGEEQPLLFRVDQEANVPYATIVSTGEITLPSASGPFTIAVNANIDWSYSLDNDDWIEELDVSDTEIKLYASKNRGDERSVTLTVTGDDYPGATSQVVIKQASGSVLLLEDFSWLTYGSTVPYEWENAVRYDNWTPEEQARGWEVTPNEFTSNQRCCYACYGYVKLGKTNYGGDLITPALDIEGTVDLKVSFKSAVYISAAGNVDDNILKVFALGAGTPSVDQFEIDNVPNSQAEDEAGIVNNIWDPERGYSFTVTDATSDTRIKFLGGDYALAGVGQGKNRIFLDDIKIEIVQ